MVYEEVIVRCADRDLHSGLFGGAAQNPIRVLSRIIADLHDADGRITIPGFYDGVPETPKQVLEQWRKLDLTPEDFLGQVGLKIPAGEKGRMLIEQIQSRPTCDVNGIVGGYTGVGAKTVIAGEASAKISFRLVGDQDPEKISEAFKAFVRARIPADCSVEFVKHKGSRPIQLPYDMPALTAAKTALADEWGREPVTIGTGGSIPIVGDFKRTLGLDTAPRRLRPRRRPGAFAEREIRPQELPQGRPQLGADPGGPGELSGGRVRGRLGSQSSPAWTVTPTRPNCPSPPRARAPDIRPAARGG